MTTELSRLRAEPMPGESTRVCPECGETKTWGGEFSACETCDPAGASGPDDEVDTLQAQVTALRAQLAAATERAERAERDLAALRAAVAVTPENVGLLIEDTQEQLEAADDPSMPLAGIVDAALTAIARRASQRAPETAPPAPTPRLPAIGDHVEVFSLAPTGWVPGTVDELLPGGLFLVRLQTGHVVTCGPGWGDWRWPETPQTSPGETP